MAAAAAVAVWKKKVNGLGRIINQYGFIRLKYFANGSRQLSYLHSRLKANTLDCCFSALFPVHLFRYLRLTEIASSVITVPVEGPSINDINE